jgi:hypothetical protein
MDVENGDANGFNRIDVMFLSVKGKKGKAVPVLN